MAVLGILQLRADFFFPELIFTNCFSCAHGKTLKTVTKAEILVSMTLVETLLNVRGP